MVEPRILNATVLKLFAPEARNLSEIVFGW